MRSPREGWEFNVWVVSESTNGTPIQLGNREFKDEAQLVQSIVREDKILTIGLCSMGEYGAIEKSSMYYQEMRGAIQ
ncbi:hypothetical protein NL676_020924 [Syzygium grande]|nr:hypothetical protein NL676_020924 [Syzygium grande]